MSGLKSRFLSFCTFALCTGLGSGCFPRAPGTAGSIAALVFWYLAHHFEVIASLHSQVILAVSCTTVGILATHLHLKMTENGVKDPQYIVIDEWAGLFITLSVLPSATGIYPLIGFALFRIIDIRKPGPIRQVEKLPGALGVMGDDILAGLIGAGILWCLLVSFQ